MMKSCASWDDKPTRRSSHSPFNSENFSTHSKSHLFSSSLRYYFEYREKLKIVNIFGGKILRGLGVVNVTATDFFFKEDIIVSSVCALTKKRQQNIFLFFIWRPTGLCWWVPPADKSPGDKWSPVSIKKNIIKRNTATTTTTEKKIFFWGGAGKKKSHNIWKTIGQ